jgi:hypothetical protein
MPDAFTIRIFVPDGDPEGVRLIDRMNWTGVGLVFPRAKWPDIRGRSEFTRAGIYILSGYTSGEDEDGLEDELPTIYVGQADGVRSRIDDHHQKKDFWDTAVVFVSTSGGLNRAHVTWLEYALIERATRSKQCRLDNGNAPQEPVLTEAEKADTQGFLKEILQILPLVNVRVFETPKAVAIPRASTTDAAARQSTSGEPDTIIVPARKDGFDRVFLGQDAWWSVRISGGMLNKIKFIAAYQTDPVRAITHYAPVDRIEPYGDGKYKLIFSETARKIGPIVFGDAASGTMQGPRYTTLTKLKAAKKLTDLWGKPALM